VALKRNATALEGKGAALQRKGLALKRNATALEGKGAALQRKGLALERKAASLLCGERRRGGSGRCAFGLL
jgi:hypothetical protein